MPGLPGSPGTRDSRGNSKTTSGKGSTASLVRVSSHRTRHLFSRKGGRYSFWDRKEGGQRRNVALRRSSTSSHFIYSKIERNESSSSRTMGGESSWDQPEITLGGEKGLGIGALARKKDREIDQRSRAPPGPSPGCGLVSTGQKMRKEAFRSVQGGPGSRGPEESYPGGGMEGETAAGAARREANQNSVVWRSGQGGSWVLGHFVDKTSLAHKRVAEKRGRAGDSKT